MVGRWARWIIVYGLLACILIDDTNATSDCWEKCFAESQRGPENAEYEQIFELTQVFKKVAVTDANTGSGTSNGTVLLLDSTLPYDTSDMDTDRTTTIQKKLAQVLAFTLPVLTSFNPGFIVKYDDSSAWSCDGWKCLGRCDMYDVLEEEHSNLRHFADSNTVDQLDDSCELASAATTSSTCIGTTHNTFAIAIVNSDFKTAEADYTNLDDLLFSGLDILSDFPHLDDDDIGAKDHREFNYYCDKHFPKKAVVGTYLAAASSMASFPSATTRTWPGYTQMTFSPTMQLALERITHCMQSSCCSDRKRDSYNVGQCSKFSKGYINEYMP